MALGSTWNSLEIAKLAVGILTPILLVGLGVLINRATQRIESAEWSKRKLIEKRIEIFEKMAPLLNDLYVFFFLRGHFLEVTPPRAIQIKRKLDKTFWVDKFLFDEPFEDRYFAFINACFETYSGVAKPAELLAATAPQKVERGNTWRDDWIPYFTSTAAKVTPLGVIEETYNALMAEFAVQVGATAA